MVGRALFVCVLLAALYAPAPAAAALTLPSRFAEVTVASGLADPTALAYAPDGRLFVAEKAGRLRVVSPTGGLAAEPVIDIQDHVAAQGDRGLLGIAVDAAFATNGFVYLLYTYEPAPSDPWAEKPARLTRIKVNPDNTVATGEEVLLGSINTSPCPPPSNASDCMPSTSDSHTIGTVRSDPDGTLWVGAGDGAAHQFMDPTALRTYDERSLAGKLIHIDREGRGLPDHPFCPSETNLDAVCTKLYAKGFRNPFRFHLRPGSSPVVGDVGWNRTEELDLVEAGKNYGWPCYEGAEPTWDYQELSECQALYEDQASSPRPPAFEYEHRVDQGGAVVAGPQYTGSLYPPAYRGAWFVGDYAQGWLKAYDIAGGKITNVRDFATAGFDGVDLAIGPDGDLVYLRLTTGESNSGRVVRIVYGNAPPPAVAHASPTAGPSPLTVTFSADEAVDPDGDAVTYEWDFDGDGDTDAAGRVASHEYTASGRYDARLTVRDALGLASTDTVTVAVDITPPVASIDAPANGSLFRHGVPVVLRGSAFDADEGSLPGSALAWRIVLHHESHTHLVLSGATGSEISFVPPGDHDADSYYAIELTATDADGLNDKDEIEIRPETVGLRLASSPPGVALAYGGRQYTTPAQLTAAIGFRTSVAAPDTVTAAGHRYRFAGWSDGGARQHPIVVPARDLTLTARYTRVDPGAPTPPAAPDTTVVRPRPILTVDRPRRRSRALTGRLAGPTSKPRVLVALRTRRSGGRCRVWSADHGRLGPRTARCARRLWIRAVLTRTGAARWRWRAPLRGRLNRGRYFVTTRATDDEGRTLLPARGRSLRIR